MIFMFLKKRGIAGICMHSVYAVQSARGGFRHVEARSQWLSSWMARFRMSLTP